MGECGCEMSSRDAGTLPGPHGTTYVLRVYPSCDDCATPAGVTIDRCRPAHIKEQGLEGLKPIRLHGNLRYGPTGTAIPVLHPSVLKRRLIKFLLDVKSEQVSDAIGAEVVAEEFMDCFRDMIEETARSEDAGESGPVEDDGDGE